MVKIPLIHEVFARKTPAFNPGHSCRIMVSESKIFPEKFTSHNNFNVGCKILNVIHIDVYSLQTLFPICQLRLKYHPCRGSPYRSPKKLSTQVLPWQLWPSDWLFPVMSYTSIIRKILRQLQSVLILSIARRFLLVYQSTSKQLSILFDCSTSKPSFFWWPK